jgi:hypothetical protein
MCAKEPALRVAKDLLLEQHVRRAERKACPERSDEQQVLRAFGAQDDMLGARYEKKERKRRLEDPPAAMLD